MEKNLLQLSSQVDFIEVSKLIDAFKALQQQTDTHDLQALNAEKLVIIEQFQSLINQRCPSLLSKSIDEANEQSLFLQACRKLFYQFLLSFGLFQDAVGSYLFWKTLFLLIPHIANPVVLVASLVSTALGSVLYYAFQVAYLKDAFDLPQDHTNLGLLLASYSSQLDATIAINNALSSMLMLPVDNDLYDQYVVLTRLLNQDLRDNNTAMPAYQETAFKQSLKAATLTFGAVASVASSYFTATLLISLLAAPLLGTPVGWALILLTVVADLGYYYALGASSMATLINPDTQTYQSVKANLIKFDTTYHDDLKQIQVIKQSYSVCFFKNETSVSTLCCSDTSTLTV